MYAFCPLNCPAQGDIVGREYMNFCKFMGPYGTFLADLTIAADFASSWKTRCRSANI
jgi:hypothetical protein